MKYPELWLSTPPYFLLCQLVPKHKKQIQPRKTSTVTAPRKPGEAKEEAPKKGGQTKDREAGVSKARKALQQQDKATNAPPGASGPRGKSKVKGRSSSPGRCVGGERKAWQSLDVRWGGGAGSGGGRFAHLVNVP